MKDNITKIVRRALLSEQGTGGDQAQQELAQKITNPTLKVAWNQGCFPKGAQVFTLKGNQVMWVNSTKVPGFPVAILHAPAEGQHSGLLEYWKSVNGELTEKSPKNLTWSCASLRKLTQDAVNPELTKFVDAVRTANPDLRIFTYSDSGVTETNKVNGVCKLTKLFDVINDEKSNLQSRNDINSLLTPEIQQMKVWVCAQSSETSQNKALIDKYTSEGYGFTICNDAQMATIDAKQKGKTSGQIESIEFIKVGGTSLCRTANKNIDKNQTYQNLEKTVKLIQGNEVTKENCRVMIDNYLSAANQGLKIPQDQINDYKSAIETCQNNDEIKLDGFLSKKFTKAIESLKYYKTKTYRNLDGTTNTLDYRISGGVVVRESKELLKSLIRENLIQLSESKKKVLLEENNIIVNRFSVITEGVTGKTKKQKSKIFNDLVNESYNLTSQGFNQTLINEQFWDVIKSFFGNTGSGVVQMFSERIVKTILETLTPLDKDGWVANIIISTIGNIPPADYVNGKIFSCEYISDKLSKGIVEGMVRKVQNESGMEGPIYDIIRNSMIEMAEDTEFGMKIETMIGDLICPKLSGVKEKMSKTAEDIKSKALA